MSERDGIARTSAPPASMEARPLTREDLERAAKDLLNDQPRVDLSTPAWEMLKAAAFHEEE